MSTTDFTTTRDWYDPPGNAKTPTDIEIDPADVHVATSRYTSAAYLQLEYDFLWSSTWHLVCRESHVAKPGDYFVYDIGARSYIVMRGNDGAVRAFHNTCRHRATRLVNGRGSAGKHVTCPYHMWSYGLDGSLLVVPDRETFCEFEDADYGLAEVGVGTWAGFVFLHPDAEPAEPLTEFLGPLPEMIDPYKYDDAVTTLEVTMPCSANWKVLVEAFVEMYHVQSVHPQLLELLDDVNTFYEGLGRHSYMVVPTAVTSERLGDSVGEIERLEGFIAMMADGVGVRSRENRSAGEETAAALRQMFSNEAGELELPEGTSVRDAFMKMAKDAMDAKGIDLSGLRPEQFLDDYQFHVFPNVIMNCYAGLNMFLRFRPHATDPNSCMIDLMLLELISDPEETRTTPG